MRDHVLIVGSGNMGSGIAARSALAGSRTFITNRTVEKAQKGRDMAITAMRELVDNELATEEQFSRACEILEARVLDSSVLDQSEFVIEAVYENLELKQQVFQELDAALPPEVIIASNTSGMRITDIAAKTVHKERCLTTHFWFPGHLVPLVEVVMSDWTKYEYAVATKERLASWGKAPVIVKKDCPGHLANRILQAVIREATNIVEMGLASPEDVDTAVKMGMGIRFPIWGPLEHIDAVGLDICTSVQDTVLPVISSLPKANDLMRNLTESGNLGYKTGKGIFDWSKLDMEEKARKRNEFIIYALKKIELPK